MRPPSRDRRRNAGWPQLNSSAPRLRRLLCKTSRKSFYMLSILSCINFRSGQCFRAAPAENCFAKRPVDLPMCCKLPPASIAARGGRAPRIQAQLNFSAPHLRRIALPGLPYISCGRIALPCAVRSVCNGTMPCGAVRCQKTHGHRTHAAVRCHAVQCAAVRCRAVPSSGVRCNTMPCGTVRCHSLP